MANNKKTKRINANKTSKIVSDEEIAVVNRNLISAVAITRKTFYLIWNYKKFWIILFAWYVLANILFVKGLSSNLNIVSLRNQFSHIFSGSTSKLNSSLSVLFLLVGSTGGNSSQSSGSMNFILIISISLITIWSLNKIYDKESLKVKQAIYQGLTPVVPFIIVVFYLALELIPATIGGSVYSVVKVNSIAVGGVEKILWFFFFLLLTFWSFYMVSGHIFSLYIVSKENLSPIAALKKSKKLVKGIRLLVLRKVLFLPLLLVVLITAIMIPSILIFNNFSSWIFYLLTILMIPLFHSYLYVLWRELTNES